MGRTVMFSWEPIFIASGAIMGMRVCLSILARQHRVLDGFCSGAATRRPHHARRLPRMRAMGALAGRVVHGICQPAEFDLAMADFAPGLR